MRVALVSLNARAGDAIGRQLVDKVAALVDRNFTVHVVVVDSGHTHPALEPYVVRWRTGDRTAWQVLADADLIVVEFSQFHPLLEQLPLLADGRRRFVFDYHGLTPPDLALPPQRGDLLRGQDWLGLAQLADVVVTHSKFAERELLDSVDVPLANRMQMGYPIETATDPANAGLVGWARPTAPSHVGPFIHGEGVAGSTGSAHPTQDTRQLLFVGRAAPNKRIPVLIRAIAELKHEHPPTHATIVGPSGGAHESERLKCRELAADLGVADRIHWLGEVDEVTLQKCYQSADAFVIPSLHEGFCFPVLEAMAHGVPVIAARAAALPETIGTAGLLFTPDDPRDLAQQVRRLFAKKSSAVPQRIAVVTPRFGAATGGAERSLSLIAQQLHQAGRDVTVLTTRVDGANPAPFPVRTFAVNPIDSDGWYQTNDNVESEAAYWQHTLRSDDLLDTLRREQFDAIIVGPYLMGLTRDVVRQCGNRTILVPCLHDESVARLAGVAGMFQQVGGVLYHGSAERDLAIELGLTHPNQTVIGTLIDVATPGHGQRGQRLVGANEYFVYCGRLIREKGVPQLIEQARRFAAGRPIARFAFIGVGDVVIPNEDWAIHLGELADSDKRDVLAGASALISLSNNESLSLVVLEANAVGTPVVVRADCAAMADHVIQGGGGSLIRRDADFARCLDRLLDHPQLVRELGQRGQEYVRSAFGSADEFQRRLTGVIAGTTRPIRLQMIERGRARAAEFGRTQWRESFEQVVESALTSMQELRPAVVEFVATDATIPATELVAIKIQHLGGRPLIPTGPARTELLVRVRTPDGDVIAEEIAVPLRRWLTTGSAQLLAFGLPTNIGLGPVVIEAGLRTWHGTDAPSVDWHGPIASVEVVKKSTNVHMFEIPSRSAARMVRRARQVSDLPTGYVDVTTGWAARMKKWIKAKVLHNFRTAYVDVLAHQQSRFNERVVESLEQLADAPHRADAQVQAEIAQTRRQCDELSERVAQLEAATRRPSKIKR